MRMVGIMKSEAYGDDPDPIPVGDEGTVIDVNEAGTFPRQIFVEWDNDRSLILLENDPFIIVR